MLALGGRRNGLERWGGAVFGGVTGIRSETWDTLIGHTREILRFLDHAMIKEKSG